MAPRTAPAPAADVDRAVARAAAHLASLQRTDGSWDEPCDDGPATTAQALVTLAEMGRLEPGLRRRALAFLAQVQAPDGGFEAYPGAGTSALSATAAALAAFARLDDGAHASTASRAAAWIAAHGGFDAVVGAFGRGEMAAVFLAVAGLLPPHRLPDLPSAWIASPVLRRLVQRRIHAGVPMAVSEVALIRRWLVAGRMASPSDRDRAVTQAITRLHDDMQNPSGSFFHNVPQTCLAVLGLIGAGIPLSDPRIRRAGDWLCGMVEAGPEGTAWFPAFRSGLWSTALSLRALLRASDPASSAGAVRALEWLVAAETEQPESFSARPGMRLIRTGGFGFQGDNTRMPDCDDTAVAVEALAIALAALPLSPAMRLGARRRIACALAWLIGMQNADGGWAAFLQGMPSKPAGPVMTEPLDFAPPLRWAAFRGLEARLLSLSDPSTEDVTARSLRALSHCGFGADHPLVARAVAFLRAQQCTSGAFWGRWSTNYLWATAHVLLGLRAVGVDPARPWVQRAIDFVIGHQNGDGGFGETERSYRDPSLAGTGPSMPVVTALCLEALCAAGEAHSRTARRAAECLLATQDEFGAWPRRGHLQVVIPPSAFYTYPGASRFQPLEALIAYREAVEPMSI
jgi:squalene-hopene/tetraprenyl-beta-curcumene cyclase